MDVEDQQSVRSYNSSQDSKNFHRAIEGRIFNSSNPLYFLPADETEWSRLDKQHLMLLLGLGGPFAAPSLVKARLQYEFGVEKSVLDLGTGGGIWAVSVAQEFPHVQVVGVDLAPSTTRPPPSNCRFEFDNVNWGLSHYHGKFDVVHARSTANGIPGYEAFIAECGWCLKPGGILLLTEGDFQLYDENLTKSLVPLEGDLEKSWFQRMLFEAYNVMKKRGSSMDAGHSLHTYLSRNPTFEHIGYQHVLCPVGPWKEGESVEETHQLHVMGTLMRQNATEFVRALKPLLVSEGYPPETVQTWIEQTENQLNSLTPRTYTKWHFCWGVLKKDPGEGPIQPLPTQPSSYGLTWPLPDVRLMPPRASSAA